MNIMTFNVRGCGNDSKRRRIRQIIKKGIIDLCLIKETKTKVTSEGIVKGLWGNQLFGWSAKGPEGQSEAS